MAVIHVLSTHVANLIAAGEVVERPASAAKELIENAVDAGASAITVEIKSGGIAYLRVTDNGCGISRDDVPTAFKRHSTSKIRDEEDLSHISTLGFRGEALAAIASVSKIDLLTKQAESDLGVSLHQQGGEIISIEDAGCPDGTTIVVRELFYNTPARMKFLKKDAAEGAAVESVVQAAALSHPEISIKFIREGKQVLHTPGDNDLRSCVYSIFGRDISAGMLETKSDFQAVSVKGFVSTPFNARGNRMMQYFFVNGRPVKSRFLSVALEEAYKDSLMKGRFPMCVIFINMPFEQVDVNVHPAKTEVKFAREREIFDAVYFAAKSALSGDTGRQTAVFEEKKEENVFIRDEVKEVIVKPVQRRVEVKPISFTYDVAQAKKSDFLEVAQTVKPYSGKPTGEKRPATSISFKEPEASKVIAEDKQQDVQVDKSEADSFLQQCMDLKSFEEKETVPVAMAEDTVEEENPKLPVPEIEYRVVGEVLNTYIIVEQGESVLLIDKHAAHERIVYNNLVEMKEEAQKQMLLVPVVVRMTQSELVALFEHKQDLEALGFDFDRFGQDCIAVRQVPDGIDDSETEILIGEIAQALLDGKIPGSIEKLDAVRHSVACKAAIKAGKPSDIKELETVVKKVMTDPDIRYCPHGRPVTVEMTKYQLEKQFKRVT